MAGGFDQVFHAGCLTDQHAALVIFFQNAVQCCDLFVHLIACRSVFRDNQQKLPAVALQDLPQVVRKDFQRHVFAHQCLQTENGFYTLDGLHLAAHGADVFLWRGGVHQNHMGGGNIELILKLGIGDHILHILRQTLTHIVVDLVIGLLISIPGRKRNQHEHNQQNRRNFQKALGGLRHIRDQAAVFCLLQRLIQKQNHGRQNGHTADDAQDNALGHHDAEIPAHGERHEAQCNEAGHRGDGAAQHAGKGLMDRTGHRLFVILRMDSQLFVVAVPQEDGIIHRDGQLQDCGQGLGDVGDLTEEDVGA